jgi:hypothetical protein
MAVGYRYSTLLSAIRRRVKAPNATAAGSADADLVELCDSETLLRIVPKLLKVREDHYVTYKDITLVANQRNYPIPYRAVGGVIRMAALVNTAGDVIWVHKSQIQNQEDSPGFYFIQGNEIWLNEVPANATDVLRVWFQIRPNQLVSEATSVVGVVSSVNTSTKVVTLTTTKPSTITTSTPVDVIRGVPGFDHMMVDVTLAAASGSSLTFSTLPTGLAAGDYICLAEQTPVPQMPAELHPLLAHYVTELVCEKDGNATGLSNARDRIKRVEGDVWPLLTPRVASDPTRAVSRNPLFSAVQPSRIVRGT